MAKHFETEDGTEYIVLSDGTIRLESDEYYVLLTYQDLEEMQDNADNEADIETYL